MATCGVAAASAYPCPVAVSWLCSLCSCLRWRVLVVRELLLTRLEGALGGLDLLALALRRLVERRLSSLLLLLESGQALLELLQQPVQRVDDTSPEVVQNEFWRSWKGLPPGNVDKSKKDVATYVDSEWTSIDT